MRKNGSKNVSQISIVHPSKGLYSLFSKKNQIRLTSWSVEGTPCWIKYGIYEHTPKGLYLASIF